MSGWTLHLGDSIAGMATLAGKSIDSVITDPPFEEEAHTLQCRVRRGPDGQAGTPLKIEPLPFPPITADEREACAREFARLARRWVLIFCQVEAAHLWREAGEAAGLTYRRTCIWVKPDGMPQYSGDRPGMGYETLVALHAPGRSTWNGGGQHGVFRVNKGGDQRAGHPTQKPLALMEKLVELFTDPGETILDPFSGSGTTGVAAIRLGRRFIGWERDPKYHAVAMKRLSAAREQLRMFDPPAAGTRRETTSTETTTNQGDEHDDVRASAGFAEEGPSRGARGLEPSGHVAGTADARRALEDDPAVHLHHAGGRVPRAVGGEPAGHAGRGLVREVAAKPRRVTVLDEHGREVGP